MNSFADELPVKADLKKVGNEDVIKNKIRNRQTKSTADESEVGVKDLNKLLDFSNQKRSF